MAGVKRKCDTEVEEDTEVNQKSEVVTEKKKRRRVEFQDVTVYHFNRRQGHVCVPSQVSSERLDRFMSKLLRLRYMNSDKTDNFLCLDNFLWIKAAINKCFPHTRRGYDVDTFSQNNFVCVWILKYFL